MGKYYDGVGQESPSSPVIPPAGLPRPPAARAQSVPVAVNARTVAPPQPPAARAESQSRAAAESEE